MAPALACGGSLQDRLQTLQCESGLLLGEQDTSACHLFAFAGKGSAMSLS